MQDALRALVAAPDPQGAGEIELHRRLAYRDELARRVGPAVLRLLADGGNLRIEPPRGAEPEPEPEPATELPEPPPVEVRPAAPPDLSALVGRGLGPRWDTPEPPDVPRKSLRAVLDEIGRPTRAVDATAAEGLVEGILTAIREIEAWTTFPSATQRALLGLASSVARHVQDEAPAVLSASTGESLRAVFSTLTRWSKDHRPGFVPGLSRNNEPDDGSWYADASSWWATLDELAGPDRSTTADEALAALELAARAGTPVDLSAAILAAVDAGVSQGDGRLLRLLGTHLDVVATLPGCKTLKAALRAASRPETALDDPGPSEPAVPSDWPLFELTSGKRAVVLGGDRRAEAAERIREEFRFVSVAWESTDPRRIQALAHRIRSKSSDLVILLRAFIGHPEQAAILEACRESGVRFVVVDSGYGVTQVKLAIERYLRAEP